MITKEKIEIFKKYDSDIDLFSRSGSKNEKLNLNDNEWFFIERLVEDRIVVKRNLASKQFELEFNIRLKKNCDTEETAKKIICYADSFIDLKKISFFQRLKQLFR